MAFWRSLYHNCCNRANDSVQYSSNDKGTVVKLETKIEEASKNSSSPEEHLPKEKPRKPSSKIAIVDQNAIICEEKVIDPTRDRRVHIKDTYSWPNSPTGRLKITFSSGNVYLGTGTMIGPWVVLTVAHNVYSWEIKEEAISIEFIPGDNDVNSDPIFGIHKVDKFCYPEEYKKDKSEDYAVLFLKPHSEWSPLGAYTGIYGLRCFDRKSDREKIFTTKGYPIDKTTKRGYQMWGMTDKIDNGNSKDNFSTLNYQFDTEAGQSGSGVLIEEEQTIVGVHAGASKNENFNYTKLITETRLKRIKDWIQNYYKDKKDQAPYSKLKAEEYMPQEKCREPNPPETYKSTPQPAMNDKNLINQIHIKMTHQWSNSAIGLLNVTFQDGTTRMGSGSIIGPYIVLTSAQNIYDISTQQAAISISFIPAKNNRCCPFGDHKAEKWYYPDNFKEKSTEDYAIVFLTPHAQWKPLGNFTGIYGLRCLDKANDIEKTLSLKGYPTDKVIESSHQLWSMSSKLSSKDISLNEDIGVINLKLDKFGNQSGSCIIIEEEQTIIGVHSKTNQATLITPARLNQIHKWIKRYYNSVTKLNLGDLNLYPGGIKELKNFRLPNLLDLNLDNNHIGPEGAHWLSEIHFPYLQKLTLRNNKIGPKGAQYLSSSKFQNLESLDLYKNAINDEGVQAICQATFSSLVWLNLEDNNIGNSGVQLIISSRKRFSRLETLQIKNNSAIKPSEINRLRDIFKKVI